jgi:hypothetical protein
VLPASGLSATGEAVLTPDPGAHVAALPWHPSHGLALCDLRERSGASCAVGCCVVLLLLLWLCLSRWVLGMGTFRYRGMGNAP